ncbi:LysR substrate-binding domain-containing protein [Paraburkholderia nemoris]|uniref:LysR substrate-binding domain-containing protein n=1 Tax=Paraburkholderia nemoris TaxID=2793076 RepID=UPI0038B7AE74
MNVRVPLKLRQLQYFLTASQTLHFSRAADQLFVTQPTLSHQIAELESHVGMPLFDRMGKAVRLTEAGTVFALYARRALSELEAGCNALAELEGMVRGTLRIGVSQSFVRKLLPPILGEFARRCPSITLSIEEMTARGIEDQLSEGLIDLGIAFAPSVLDETELEPILEERLLLVTGVDNPLGHRDKVDMAELNNVSLALFSQHYSTRKLINRYLAEAGAVPRVMCETNTIDVLLGIVAESPIATIVPEGALVSTSNLCIVPLSNPVPIRISALLWAKHAFKTAPARTFAHLVRERFKTELPLV